MSRRVKAETAGVLTGTVISVLIVALMSFIFVKIGTVPDTAAVPCALAALCIGAFLGGYICAKTAGSFGMMMGALSGFFLFVILLAAGCAAGSEPGIVSLLRLAAAVLCGALGGIAGVNKKKRRK